MRCSDSQKEYIKAGLIGAGIGTLGWGVEAARQNYLVKVDDNKADSFIKNTANRNLQEKYKYIRENFNSKNTEIAKEAKRIGRSLKFKLAFACFALFETAYLATKLAGRCLHRHNNKDFE